MRDASALYDQLSVLCADSSADDVIDPGSETGLKHFVESRLADHKAVVRLTDTLARTFVGSASIPAHIRALGLLGLDNLPPLRNRFTLHSMGYQDHA